jgi:hypothetical protein
MASRKRQLVGFIEPCLPSPAKALPSGPDWIHEIKHDGFRIMARRDAAGVRLITRKGNDLTRRFPFIAIAVAALPVPSCLIDGEAIVSDEAGLAVFDRIRGHGGTSSPFFLCLAPRSRCASSRGRLRTFGGSPSNSATVAASPTKSAAAPLRSWNANASSVANVHFGGR